MFLLFSHKLTNEQEEDAKKNHNVDKFVYLPEELQKLWSNIPPELETLSTYLNPIKKFFEKECNKNDLILIQGDSGAVCEMVNYTKMIGAIPIYSTTKRVIKEKNTKDGVVKVSLFSHILFRRF